MRFFDLLFSPKGTIEPEPLALAIIGVYRIDSVAASWLRVSQQQIPPA